MEDEAIITVRACSYGRAQDMLYYISKLTKKVYREIRVSNRRPFLRIHRHLQRCDNCREGYIQIKGRLSAEEEFINSFSGDNFRLLRENEAHLDSL